MRKFVEDKELTINWIEVSAILADSLTKVFPRTVFKGHQEKLKPVE